MSKMLTISDLLGLHGDLDEMFFEHQKALLHMDFERALRLLRRYRDALFVHMQDEEEVLLPVYAERVSGVKGGGPELFLNEHIKMRGMVTTFEEKTAELAGESSPESGLLMLLDRESFFKRLCSHHDIRESEILYPELDRVTTDEEKAYLLGQVTNAFEAAAAAREVI